MPEFQIENTASGFASQVHREPGAEAIRSCYACGTCTAGCPVRRVNLKYNPRKLIRMVLLGMQDEVLKGEEIWLCSSCYTCQERCPQGIRITDTILALRNLAAKEGHAPSGIFMQAKLIKGQGRLYALDEFDEKKRKKAGLPSLPSQVEGAIKLVEE
ncbi:MAG: 4Fe-4S dicluster domain-containing protein [Desulfatiglandaceae bacterium]